jgi:DNA-directed RNA polymerase
MWGVGVLLETLPDVFTVRTEGVAKNTREYLELSDDAWAVVDVALDAAINRNPVFFPSVETPKPWDAWNGCGPTDPRVNGIVTFLRSHGKDTAAAMRGAIRSGQAKPALDGVNTLQGVAWTINTAMLDIITECAEKHLRVPGLPQWTTCRSRRSCRTSVWAGLDEDRQRFVRQRKAELHQLNRAAKCDRIQFDEDMKVARSMAVRELLLHADELRLARTRL